MEKLKIEAGDDSKRAKVSMSVSEMKALYNLILEEGMIDEMEGYRKTAEKLKNKIEKTK